MVIVLVVVRYEDMTILPHLIENAKFNVKLSTVILYVSKVIDTPKMFMSQRLNNCLGMGIDHVGMGGNWNVKSHSRSSLMHSLKSGVCQL